MDVSDLLPQIFWGLLNYFEMRFYFGAKMDQYREIIYCRRFKWRSQMPAGSRNIHNATTHRLEGLMRQHPGWMMHVGPGSLQLMPARGTWWYPAGCRGPNSRVYKLTKDISRPLIKWSPERKYPDTRGNNWHECRPGLLLQLISAKRYKLNLILVLWMK